MSLRFRLALGIAAIALALVAPLLISARSLRRLSSDTARLRDREYAATLLLGRMRGSAEELAQRTEILTLFPSDTTRAVFLDRVRTLSAEVDTLQRLTATVNLAKLRVSLIRIEAEVPDVYDLAVRRKTAEVDSLVDKDIRPILADVRRVLEVTEAALQDRTREQVEDFAAESSDARRWSAFALAGAGVLALLIAIWLTQSVSRPLDELEQGMRAVAQGDFGRHLAIDPNRIDEFGKLSESYRSMTLQLRDLDRLKAEFISVASHELKTPINVIGGYLQLLQEGVYGELTPRQREILQTIGAQSQQLSRLVRQLLDVSRFEAGGGKLDLRPVNLPAFLTDLERAFRVLALQREVNFVVRRDRSLPDEVIWDPERMNEVLGNILSNAFKFTPKGGTVELGVSSTGSSIRMQLRDTGAGIPPEQLRYIFEKFYQADNQNNTGSRGTGLGLAIARGIINAHGGTITAESNVGEGTTFTILIPAQVLVRRSLTPSSSGLALS